MPLNTLRLNHQASSHPNDRIVFIKPLPRPSTQQADYDIADTFLRAIAAQCLPIMKKHWLSVTTLEEYEPNREFVGRNFNNGECIQLVLRSRTGSWLPFNMVQMVMMHELAHNAHMNHGKMFWQSRNVFADELKELWQKGYSGEGFWGSGRALGDMSTAMGNNVLRSEELGDLPLCGGTYRSRRRKRKAKSSGEELTWKEKRDRRIEKKFGKNGVSLGEDEDKRLFPELGKRPAGGNPRVAQSKRGRELRAAAALARFDTNMREVEGLKEEAVKEEETDSDDYEEADGEDARDINGKRMQDKDGRGLTRVCEDEDMDDVQVKQELREMESLDQYFQPARRKDQRSRASESNQDIRPLALTLKDIPQHPPSPSDASTETADEEEQVSPRMSNNVHGQSEQPGVPNDAEQNDETSASLAISTISCPVCSLENSPLNATCIACGNVLDIKKDPKHWQCKSAACQGISYLNGGDAGICGLCGERKP